LHITAGAPPLGSLQVAVELEEAQEHERRKASMQIQELNQRVSQLEIERMQSQLQ